MTDIPHLTAGWNGRPPERIADEECSDVQGITFRRGRCEIDTGYAEYSDLTGVRGTPKRFIDVLRSNSVRDLILITDLTLYRRANNEWQYVDDGTYAPAITVNTTVSSGTTLSVSDTADVTIGDFIAVVLDDGTQHKTTVDAIPTPGAPGDLTVDDAFTATATAGNEIVKALVLAGDNDNQIDFVVIPLPNGQDLLAFTNGIDPLMIYSPDSLEVTKAEDRSGSNFPASTVCKTLDLTVSHQLMCGNLIESGTKKPTKVILSDVADVDEWSTGSSSSNNLVDAADFITCIKPLGPETIIYRSRSIVRATYTEESTDPFSYRTMVSGVGSATAGFGAVSPNAVVNLGDSHIFLAHNGVYRYRGDFAVEAISNDIFTPVFSVSGELDRDNISRSFGEFVEDNPEVYFFYPVEGDTFPKRAVIFNTENNSWTRRKFAHEITGTGSRLTDSAKTWQASSGSWTSQSNQWLSTALQVGSPVIMFTSASGIFEYDFVSVDDDGTAIEWFISGKRFTSIDRSNRYDFWDMKMKGESIEFGVYLDDSAVKTVVDTVTLGSTVERKRLHKQLIGTNFIPEWSGSGGGFELRDFAFKHRQESRHVGT